MLSHCNLSILITLREFGPRLRWCWPALIIPYLSEHSSGFYTLPFVSGFVVLAGLAAVFFRAQMERERE